jgi:hypothetical protein
MTGQQTSTEFLNARRSLDSELAVLTAAQPNLISLMTTTLASGLKVFRSNTPVTNNKHEWSELVMRPEQGVVNGAHNNSTTTLALVSATGFYVDMVLAFEGSDEVMYVTAVSGNNLTVVRGYGGSTAASLIDGTVTRIISRPRPEGSDPDANANSMPSMNYNYTEIFDDTFKVSGTSVGTDLAGINNLIDTNTMQSMLTVTRRINTATIYGRRVQRVKGVSNGSMGGLLQLITKRSNAAGADLDATILNTGIENIFKDGGSPNVILCNTNQARKISAFNNAKLFIQRGDATAGTSVNAFQSDLPTPLGQIQNIVVDPNFPKTKVAILDLNKIFLEEFAGRGLKEFDATLPGADAIARRILGEFTLEVLNGGEAHCILDNLSG